MTHSTRAVQQSASLPCAAPVATDSPWSLSHSVLLPDLSRLLKGNASLDYEQDENRELQQHQQHDTLASESNPTQSGRHGFNTPTQQDQSSSVDSSSRERRLSRDSPLDQDAEWVACIDKLCAARIELQQIQTQIDQQLAVQSLDHQMTSTESLVELQQDMREMNSHFSTLMSDNTNATNPQHQQTAHDRNSIALGDSALAPRAPASRSHLESYLQRPLRHESSISIRAEHQSAVLHFLHNEMHQDCDPQRQQQVSTALQWAHTHLARDVSRAAQQRQKEITHLACKATNKAEARLSQRQRLRQALIEVEQHSNAQAT